MNYFYFRKVKNLIFLACLAIATALVLLPLGMIITYVLKMGISSVDLNFFTQLPKPVGEVGGGMKHAILGTLYLVAIGATISIPVGLLCGIYLSEFNRGKVAYFLRFTIDLLTGVPSIVIGIFAYLMIVVPFKGFSAFAGGVALSIIILPIVCRSSEEILKLTPNTIREAGLALGLPRWRVIYNIVVRANLSSLITGIMLAISRAAGETAPLLFTAFGNMYLSYQVTEPMASLPVQIYNYAISPFDDWQKQAWAGALVLIFLVLGINLTARTLFGMKRLKLSFRKGNS
jgi:phosphate transport system permease protein